MGKNLDDFRELESYCVNESAKIRIMYSDLRDEYLYLAVEPELNDIERYLVSELEYRLWDEIFSETADSEIGEKELEGRIKRFLEQYQMKLPNESVHKISYYTIRNMLKFGKVDALMNDKFIEDVSCNGYGVPVFVYHWKYGNVKTNIQFDAQELDSFVVKVAQDGGRHLSLTDALAGVTMVDDSRAQLSLGREITTRGSTFSVRKFREVLLTPSDLVNNKTFSLAEMAYLWLAVENKKSVLFVGGTASGKTTSMNAIALFMPRNAKVVTIEDVRELRLPSENWIPSVTRTPLIAHSERGAIDMYELLVVALRQRPEYLLVGEVRGKEAMTLFQAMSTGHTSFSTFHADSVDAAVHRFEYPPLSIPRSMIQSLNIFSVQAQVLRDGVRTRRNLEITENLGVDPTTKNIKTRQIFWWNPEDDTFENVLQESIVLANIARFNGWDDSRLADEFESRIEFLNSMAERKVSSAEFISSVRKFQSKRAKG